MERKRDRWIDRVLRQTERLIERQADRWAERYNDKWINGRKDRQKDR